MTSWWVLVLMERYAVKPDPAASAATVAAIRSRFGPAAAASYVRGVERRCRV